MPINVQMRDGLAEIVFHGDIAVDDFLVPAKFFREVEVRLEFTPDRVTDLSDANLTSLDAEFIRRLASGRAGVLYKNKVKSAVIAPKPDQYGLARMYQACNENSAIETRLFREPASAYEWLGRPAKPA